MDTLDRIFEELTALGIEQKSLAQKIGVRPQAVTDWKNGKTKSYTKYIPQIAEALHTTSEYLLTGQGPKHRNVPESDTFSEEETAIISAYRQTDERNRQIVRLTLGLKA